MTPSPTRAAGVHTKLMTNIDLSGRTYQTAVIAPDGSDYFIGVFDGSSHTISNLKIDTLGANNHCLGLFGDIRGGQIWNLKGEDFNIIGGSSDIGGLVGSNSGTISNCAMDSNVSCNANAVGGLVGRNLGNISNCYSISIISGDIVGGLVGSNSNGNISHCYSAGIVNGNGNVGGLVGKSSWSSTISNCYSSSAVNGDTFVGGLLGNNYNASISHCYSTGTVSGNSFVGGLCGCDTGIIESSYFLDAAGPDNGIGTPLDDPNMMIEENYVGWDFSNETTNGTNDYWMMLREGEDYPRLAWQAVFDGDIAGLYGVDMVDFAEIARNWQHTGCPGNCEDADIDGSGDVGLGDLLYVAQDWLK